MVEHSPHRQRQRQRGGRRRQQRWLHHEALVPGGWLPLARHRWPQGGRPDGRGQRSNLLLVNGGASAGAARQ
jgi:hypothetical protein